MPEKEVVNAKIKSVKQKGEEEIKKRAEKIVSEGK